ncbi:hypothetical protein CERZMDRAFT_109656 [Cercospora zeae-maydis SCOH1-5]|uniref:Uncharacterized protein n=1 Tax=Cercospora zeae-maydis SCOH1-5 TaxID=717836 RepID=A0A6A6FQN5_9PEZI|nr:hypothetical protein CERZMDRAFT_109656 [Cercospora zeae-maydis SCOH1-5]
MPIAGYHLQGMAKGEILPMDDIIRSSSRYAVTPGLFLTIERGLPGVTHSLRVLPVWRPPCEIDAGAAK